MTLSFMQSLDLRSLGLISNRKFVKDKQNEWIQSLRLAENQNVDSMIHSAGITDVDIEEQEGRYSLISAFDGTIYIHDLEGVDRSKRVPVKPVLHIGRSSRFAHKSSAE